MGKHLPGFAIYQSYSPFFLIRHAPKVALLILGATLAGIPYRFLFFVCDEEPKQALQVLPQSLIGDLILEWDDLS